MALVELKRVFVFSIGKIAISTSGKSAEVNPAGTNGSACVEGDMTQGSAATRFGGVAVRSRDCGVVPLEEQEGTFGAALIGGGGVEVLALVRAALAGAGPAT